MKYIFEKPCENPYISMYKIDVKYLFISVYDKYDGKICRVFTLNLRGAFMAVNA